MKIPNEITNLIEKTVYLKTDIDQLPHIIIGVLFRGKSVLYEVAYNGAIKEVYDFELLSKKDELISLGVKNKQKN